MATKTKTPAQTDFFGATTDFTNLPPKTYRARPSDPMEAAREALTLGLAKQIDFLNGKENIKGRKWYQSTEHSGIFCQVRLSNKAMLLNGTADAFRASSIDEAKRLYNLAIDAVKGGQFDRLISDHLKALPKRAPRGSKKM